jgi:hypothetical protein
MEALGTNLRKLLKKCPVKCFIKKSAMRIIENSIRKMRFLKGQFTKMGLCEESKCLRSLIMNLSLLSLRQDPLSSSIFSKILHLILLLLNSNFVLY